MTKPDGDTRGGEAFDGIHLVPNLLYPLLFGAIAVLIFAKK